MSMIIQVYTLKSAADEGHLAHCESEIRFVTDHFNDWILN